MGDTVPTSGLGQEKGICPAGGNNALFVNLRKNSVVFFFFFYAIMIECNTTHKEMEEYE